MELGREKQVLRAILYCSIVYIEQNHPYVVISFNLNNQVVGYQDWHRFLDYQCLFSLESSRNWHLE